MRSPDDFVIEVLGLDGKVISAADVTGWHTACDAMLLTFRKKGSTCREVRIVDHLGVVISRRFVHNLPVENPDAVSPFTAYQRRVSNARPA